MVEEKCPTLKIGDWIVLTEDGLWAMDSYIFKSKKDAIEKVSFATLDSRKTPRVKKVKSGYYEYLPKDVDYGTYGDVYNIIRVTEDNLDYLQAFLDDEWESKDN